MVKEIVSILKDIRYVGLASVVAFVVFAIAVLIPNIKLLIQIIPDLSISLTVKLNLIFSLFGAIQTNFTILSASYTIAIAILFGINVALFVHYVRSQRTGVTKINGAAGIGGLISGIFGIGCAACGTFILTWVLGFIGAAGLLSFLPLGGEEFGILGVILLILSIKMITKKSNTPQTCSV
jgi:hypothetical protein